MSTTTQIPPSTTLLSTGSPILTKPSECTLDTCPISYSVYGYVPSLGWNATFLALFILSFVIHIGQGIRWRSWSFMTFISLGIAGEVTGYVGRLMMHHDVFNQTAFKIQIIALTVAPAFLAAALYLSLKHLVLVFGQHLSRIQAKWYTWIFVGCDVISIAVQAVGAAIAANGTNPTLGNNTMIFGLSFQVFTLLIFAVLAGEYAFRARKFQDGLLPSTRKFRHSRYMKAVIIAMATSYVAILIRCSYRVAEMAGGWRNSIMKDEAIFIALDGLMCTIAALVFNVFHPGRLFKESKITMDKSHEEILSTDEGHALA